MIRIGNLQSNNTIAVIAFFKHLFALLKTLDVDYVHGCVFLMDCAPIQRSAKFLDWAAYRAEKFAYLSKYTWTLAAAEFAFAFIKAKRFDIHDDELR